MQNCTKIKPEFKEWCLFVQSSAKHEQQNQRLRKTYPQMGWVFQIQSRVLQHQVRNRIKRSANSHFAFSPISTQNYIWSRLFLNGASRVLASSWKPRGEIITSLYGQCPNCQGFDLVLRSLAELALIDTRYPELKNEDFADNLEDMIRLRKTCFHICNHVHCTMAQFM